MRITIIFTVNISKLDLTKEKIAYLKFWLGIMVAVGITLMSWFLSNFRSAHWLLVVADVLALFAIGIGGYAIHIRIEKKSQASRSCENDNDHYCCRRFPCLPCTRCRTQGRVARVKS
uniref:Uncharacterized protein n=1 Tax=Candidatus Kentrum sp. LFY TaxID=2126342 RepID=A0A450WCM1_9GAMM|nr:MAG: hypothetical protein BECKLFY1418C_GA0070996_10116 [Candidatus Kentron sp. LFY]